ncbi:MAG: hypothetical protein GY739_11130 [Mesoflavibacter sp.]|nr:hypothetical protein [Mesoflavibacter sp.]
MSGYVISNALEADGETLLDEIENDLNLDTTKFVTVEEVDQTIKGHKEFTQPLVVADPTLSTHATNKQYVENYVNSHTGGGGTNAHFQSILTKDIRINTTQQAGEGRVLFTRGENGETIEASIMMDSDGGLAINSNTQPLDLAGSKIINIKDGDDDYDAVTKRQLTNGLNSKLNLSGGTMTGNLSMGGKWIKDVRPPLDDNDVTTKLFVDTVISQLENIVDDKLDKTGGTMTGDVSMGGNSIHDVRPPMGDNDVTNKLWVDTVINNAETQLENKINTKLSLSGGTMTGNTNLNNKFLYNCPNPNNPQDVANKQYVDSKASNSPISLVDGKALLDASGGLWVYGRGLGEDGLITTEGDLRIVSGDAVGMTNIVIKAHNEIQLDAHVAVNMTNSTVYNLPEPTQPTEAATKQYVDSRTTSNRYFDRVALIMPDPTGNINGVLCKSYVNKGFYHNLCSSALTKPMTQLGRIKWKVYLPALRFMNNNLPINFSIDFYEGTNPQKTYTYPAGAIYLFQNNVTQYATLGSSEGFYDMTIPIDPSVGFTRLGIAINFYVNGPLHTATANLDLSEYGNQKPFNNKKYKPVFEMEMVDTFPASYSG